MSSPTENAFTLKQLLQMSLGETGKLSAVHLKLLYCVITVMLRKLNCQDEIVKIAGYQGQCLLKILHSCKDPPSHVYRPLMRKNVGVQMEKVEKVQIRTTNVMLKLETHINWCRKQVQTMSQLFKLKQWERYSEQLEDLCDYHGERDTVIYDNFITNPIFNLRLRSAMTLPILLHMIQMEERVDIIIHRLKDFNIKIDKHFEHRDFVLPLKMKIYTLERVVDDNQNQYIEAMDEIQEMFDIKLDRAAMATLKNYLKNRFEAVKQNLRQVKRDPKSACLKPSQITKMQCLSCGNYRNRTRVIKLQSKIHYFRDSKALFLECKQSYCPFSAGLNLWERQDLMKSRKQGELGERKSILFRKQ